MNGTYALMKEAPRSEPAPSTSCDDTSLCPFWQPDLGLPASRIVRKQFLLLISHPICDILLQ